MSTRFEHFESRNDPDSGSISRLELKAAELENKFAEWRDWLDRELTAATSSRDTMHGPVPAAEPPDLADSVYPVDPVDSWDEPDEMAAADTAEVPIRRRSGGRPDSAREIIAHGRRTASHGRFSRGRKIAIAAGAAAVAITVSVLFLIQGSPSWPPSVAVVQAEITRACQNPNVASEPGQVNFACAKSTNQILWVFALMTSDDNPGFSDTQTGRKGLEPITPAQGGDIAWSLNLHHPYNADDPIDSLEVAARAVNNIIGGATLTGTNGNPTVQPGLESDPANCARYTGSGAVVSRAGYPSLCAIPVTSAAGQAALVADVYQKWLVGSGSATAQDAGVLFENANDPGDPQVQAILKALPGS